MTRVIRAIAWVWAICVLIASFFVGLAVLNQGFVTVETFLFPLLASAYAALGLLIVVRQDGNNVAWLLFAVATWIVLGGATEARLGTGAVAPDPVEIWDVLAIFWDNAGYFIALLVPLFLMFYIFPTGHFMSRRWSWAGWVAGLVVAVAIFAEGFAKEVGASGAEWTVTNPFGFHNGRGLDEGILGLIFGIGFSVLLLGATPAIVVRYRRADDAVRRQIKWAVYGLLVVAGSFVTLTFASAVLPGWANTVLFLLPLVAIPVSVTLAITRYRLYEIDKIISRTLSYALIVGLLGLIFAAGVVWLPTAVGIEDSPLLVAGTTLLVAAIFNPLRRRIQDLVDRRFNRSRYEARLVEERFATRLQQANSIDQLAELWLETVDESLSPAASGLWLKTESTSDRS